MFSYLYRGPWPLPPGRSLIRSPMILGTPGCWRSGSGASPRSGDGQWSVTGGPRMSDTRGGMFSRSRDHSQSAAQAVQAAQAAPAGRPCCPATEKVWAGLRLRPPGPHSAQADWCQSTGNTALWDHSHQLQNLVGETRYNKVWSIIVN